MAKQGEYFLISVQQLRFDISVLPPMSKITLAKTSPSALSVCICVFMHVCVCVFVTRFPLG